MRKNRPPYTLNQLLTLKRSERPHSGFWSTFDRELRRKQRLLLQTQATQDVDLETTPWSRLRTFIATTAAVAACWAIGLMLLDRDMASEPAEPSIAARTQSFEFEVDAKLSSAKARQEQSPIEETTFIEVPNPIASAVSIEPVSPAHSKEQAILRAQNARSPNRHYAFNHTFTLELDPLIEPINFDEAIAFNADENITNTILEKYLHPLSDRGWKYESYLADRADPLNRISAAALEIDVFNREPKGDRKLNTLTVRF